MKIRVTFVLDDDDENADPQHEMGITNACYEHLLKVIPGDDIDVERVE